MISNIKKAFFMMAISLLSGTMNAQVAQKAKDISPLLIGEKIPNTTLTDLNGHTIKTKELFKGKKSVLVFYRGGWCPYCNAQLAGLGKIENEVLELGYQIIAISPDNYQNVIPTEEKNELHYQLFSDEDATFIQKMGIAFKTPLVYKGYIPTTKHIGKIPKALPVPTVMIINEEGKIVFEYINPNYKERISSNLLISVLDALNKE